MSPNESTHPLKSDLPGTLEHDALVTLLTDKIKLDGFIKGCAMVKWRGDKTQLIRMREDADLQRIFSDNNEPGTKNVYESIMYGPIVIRTGTNKTKWGG